MTTPSDPELIKNAVELVKLTYADLLQPSFRQVGKALGTVLGLGNTVLLPIKMLNEKVEARFNHHLDMYRAKLDHIPDDEIVPVHPEIGVPILERFTYVQNEELSKMFVNLLANASSAETMNLAHPSFVWAVDNLTPDEAKIIDWLAPNGRIFYMIPFGYKPVSSEVYRSQQRFTLLEEELELSFPENILFYLDNLSRIGIIHDPLGGLYSPAESEISKIFESKFAQELTAFKESNPEIHSVEAKLSYYEFTEYGYGFKQAVSD